LLRHDRKKIFAILKPQPVWRIAFFPSFMGAYPCILLWIGSFKYAKASVAGIITQLSVFFTVILAGLFLREPLTTKKWLALGLAIMGSLLVTFSQS
jgi:drug/metabolite transporter (DMT)-like permease